MQSEQGRAVILGSGGTIAGRAASGTDQVGYRAAQIGVAELVAAVPGLAGVPIDNEQVAQVDSKDMSFEVWQRLAERAAHHLARPDVAGVVITHGTDTLEETAYFLHRVLGAPDKPLVLTAAMRPATSLQADGPQNLLDAVTVARFAGAHGVLAVLSGTVYAGSELRKLHTYRLDAFGSGDSGPLAVVEQGRLRRFRTWPISAPLGLAALAPNPADWPRVEIIISHAGAGSALVQALVAQRVHGIVVAGTGNGTLHEVLEAALQAARASGVAVLRTTRCALGSVVVPDPAPPGSLPAAALTAVQARIELMLELMPRSQQRAALDLTQPRSPGTHR
jgi:L-asparaginase